MKKRIIALALAGLMMLSLSSCSFLVFNAYEQFETRTGGPSEKPIGEALYVDDENSSFSDAQRAEDEVIYICEVAVCNRTEDEQAINLIGDFETEYDAGIITEIYLAGMTEAGGDVFFVPAESTEYYTVCFVGKISDSYDSEVLKMDRSLPVIYIEMANID